MTFLPDDHDPGCKALETCITRDCDCIYDKGICHYCHASRDRPHYADCERPPADPRRGIVSDNVNWQARAEELQRQLDDLNHAIDWDTTCLNCSRLLDRCYEQTMRAETAEAVARRNLIAWSHARERAANYRYQAEGWYRGFVSGGVRIPPNMSRDEQAKWQADRLRKNLEE